jgi:hypothetical protein
MYRSIDATTAQHPLVRGIYDRVDVEPRDVRWMTSIGMWRL